MVLNNSLCSPFQNLSKIVYIYNTTDLFQQKEAYVKLSIVCIQDLSYAVFSHEQPVNPLTLYWWTQRNFYNVSLFVNPFIQRKRNAQFNFLFQSILSSYFVWPQQLLIPNVTKPCLVDWSRNNELWRINI